MSDTRRDESERVPYKAKAAIVDDFFSGIVAKPDIANNTISSTNTLGVSSPCINHVSGGLPLYTRLLSAELIFVFYGMLDDGLVARPARIFNIVIYFNEREVT